VTSGTSEVGYAAAPDGVEERSVNERTRRDEMRPLTALFADIVGSTTLGERLGPDEVKVLVGECVTRMSRAVEEFGGVIQAFMGDGICAYFGVPAAHEDDPERAARAALRIIGIAAGYAAEVEAAWGISGFNVRVGVNSGPAAVGEVGAADAQTVALGDTTNVAARLQSAAEPGSIAIGGGTASRLAERFVLEPLGDVSVKGRANPVAAWRLVGPRQIAEPISRTPLVGRVAELERLSSSADDLLVGRGTILLLLGDAGLGKTRMLGELRALVGDRATWLEGRCASYGAETPYGPFLEVLRTRLGAAEADTELVVRTKLRSRVGVLLGEAGGAFVPFLGLMLGVRLDDGSERELLPLSADELSDRMRGAYVAWVEALATERPLVIALDDLHWADRTTRELAEELLGVTDRTGLLFAQAMRPDPASEGWALRARAQSEFAHRCSELVLSPLSPAAARELIDRLAPPGIPGDVVMDEIAARAEGNPLYLEELLRAVLEAGGDRRRTWTIAPGSTDDLPPALESLLVARIDRLPPGPRRLAQVAAVVGREFDADVATSVAGSDPADLGGLLRADIVREVRRFPELRCSFRHGLIQQAAISTLTPTELRALYGRVGAVVDGRAGADELAELLAFYFYRSEDRARALPYLLRAADRAAGVEAFGHARELLERAKRVADSIGDAAIGTDVDRRLERIAAPRDGESA
jgi:class 3 adenylate cyclase